MNKSCARCSKVVYPIEELKCLDKVITPIRRISHKNNFKIQHRWPSSLSSSFARLEKNSFISFYPISTVNQNHCVRVCECLTTKLGMENVWRRFMKFLKKFAIVDLNVYNLLAQLLVCAWFSLEYLTLRNYSSLSSFQWVISSELA